MLKLKDVVNGLKVVESKRKENTIFAGDRVPVEMSELSDFTSLPCSNNFGEYFISIDKENNPVQITINKSTYMGQEQISYMLAPLTLSGFTLMIKDIIGELSQERKEVINSVYNTFLKESGIEADCQELGDLAVYQPHLNRSYILNFEIETHKYWLTFESFESMWLLKKITKKTKDVPVFKKQSKTIFNII